MISMKGSIKLMNRKSNLINIGFIIAWCLTLFLYIAIPLKNEGIMKLIYYSYYIVHTGMFVYIIVSIVKRKRIVRYLLGDYICVVGIIVAIVFSAILTPGDFTLELQFANVLSYLSMIFSIININYIKLTNKTMSFLLIINVMIAFVFIGLSLSDYAYSGIIKSSLYLGYANPNATGIYLFLSVCFLTIFFRRADSFKLKIFIGVICLYLMYLIWLTDSRTCIFTGAAVLLLSLIHKEFRVKKWMIVFVTCIPVIFLAGYTYLYAHRYFIDLTIFGKPFYSGRETYFLSVLERVKGNLLFGNIKSFPFNNTHNGSLAILASSWVAGEFFYYVFILRNLFRISEHAKKGVAQIAFAAILTLYLHASSEAAVLIGGANYSIIVSSLFMVARGNGESGYE